MCVGFSHSHHQQGRKHKYLFLFTSSFPCFSFSLALFILLLKTEKLYCIELDVCNIHSESNMSQLNLIKFSSSLG